MGIGMREEASVTTEGSRSMEGVGRKNKRLMYARNLPAVSTRTSSWASHVSFYWLPKSARGSDADYRALSNALQVLSLSLSSARCKCPTPTASP